jgi:multidrug efflux system membrane fusion protein
VASAVVVPVTALRHGPNGDYVYVLNEDSTVSQRPVTRGESSVDNVAIMSGLKAGEQVVTEGGDRLKDGARVQTQVERPAGAASAPASGSRRGQHRQGGAAAPKGGASGPAAAAPAAEPATPAKLPTAEQRQRMLDAAKDDPQQLERRKRFLEALDRGDPAALERWQRMSEGVGEGGQGGRRP